MKALRARVTRRAFGLGAIASVAVPAAARAAQPGAAAVKQRVLTLQPALEEYLLKAMADWHVPGAAVGSHRRRGQSSSPRAMASATARARHRSMPIRCFRSAP